jgi:hypothetical protein
MLLHGLFPEIPNVMQWSPKLHMTFPQSVKEGINWVWGMRTFIVGRSERSTSEQLPDVVWILVFSFLGRNGFACRQGESYGTIIERHNVRIAMMRGDTTSNNSGHTAASSHLLERNSAVETAKIDEVDTPMNHECHESFSAPINPAIFAPVKSVESEHANLDEELTPDQMSKPSDSASVRCVGSSKRGRTEGHRKSPPEQLQVSCDRQEYIASKSSHEVSPIILNDAINMEGDDDIGNCCGFRGQVDGMHDVKEPTKLPSLSCTENCDNDEVVLPAPRGNPDPAKASTAQKLEIVKHIKEKRTVSSQNGEKMAVQDQFYGYIKRYLRQRSKEVLESDVAKITDLMNQFDSTIKEWDDSEFDEDLVVIHKELCDEVIESCKLTLPLESACAS